MTVRLVAILIGLCILVAVAAPATASVSAAPLGAGNSYGCQINPNAANCKTAPAAVTNGGSVAGISQSSSTQPVQLPASGGGQGQKYPVNLLALLAGLSALAFGFLLRRATAPRP